MAWVTDLLEELESSVRRKSSFMADGKIKHVKLIRWFGRPAVVGCDGRCAKAWGINRRPSETHSDDPDDYTFLGDAVAGEAPSDPGTYEGGYAKPQGDRPVLNKWCVRECERSAMAEMGELLKLPDLENPEPNLPARRVAETKA